MTPKDGSIMVTGGVHIMGVFGRTLILVSKTKMYPYGFRKKMTAWMVYDITDVNNIGTMINTPSREEADFSALHRAKTHLLSAHALTFRHKSFDATHFRPRGIDAT